MLMSAVKQEPVRKDAGSFSFQIIQYADPLIVHLDLLRYRQYPRKDLAAECHTAAHIGIFDDIRTRS